MYSIWLQINEHGMQQEVQYKVNLQTGSITKVYF